MNAVPGILRHRTPARVRALVAATQLGLAVLAWLGAIALTRNLNMTREAWALFAATVPYVLLVRLVLFHRFRLHRQFWQHVGIRDLLDLTATVALGSLLIPVVLAVVNRLTNVTPALIVLDASLAMALIGGIRVAVRCIHERSQSPPVADGKRTLIVGAGEAGERLVRQVLHDRRCSLNVVGFVDDDPEKIGCWLHGIPVMGSSTQLRGLVSLHRIELVVIAVPSATPEQLRRLIERAVDAGVEVKLVPRLEDLVSGDVAVSEVRDVQIEDLLGRQPVTLDLHAVEPLIAGQVVLVTGAGGSIGSELARQVMAFRPHCLVLLDRAESPLHYTYIELTRTNSETRVVPVLASVTNGERMQRIFDEFRPAVVFHAAAYKHVPMLEWNVVEGVWNNVIGTLRVARSAARSGCGTFVLISTDKAVNPSSILGATKLIAEHIVLDLPSLRASATDFRVVRFGNVLGSEGSVVPLFKRQLAAGGPITVTHADVRRYFMTIREAVQLVLQATVLPEAAGRISLLEMGTQVRILDLAEQLIRLSGLVPYKDVQIVFTGLRPGEKLHEELHAPGEQAVETTVDKIRVVERNGTAPESAALARRLRTLSSAAAQRDEQAILRALSALVPEYRPAATHSLPFRRNGRHTNRSSARGNGRSHLRLSVPATAPRTGTHDGP